jgi:hypothetical protein
MEVRYPDPAGDEPENEYLPGAPTAVLEVPTHARNAELADVVDMLKVQHDLKYDIVVPSSRLAYDEGVLRVEEGATDISPEGVSLRDAFLMPTVGFDQAIATKLGIPIKYMRRLRERPSPLLLDNNVNTWLGDEERNWFVRGYRTDDPNQTGVARGFLSDQYQTIDNLDVLMTVIDALNESGISATVQSANITDRIMDVKFDAPEVRAYAEDFVKGYRNPFTGQTGPHGEGRGVIHAGFSLRNSEIGHGAFTLMPQVVIEICINRASITEDLMRKVHVGSKMEQGEVQWSERTHHHYIELIRNQTRDMVKAFLSQDYIERKAAELNAMDGPPLADPVRMIKRVASDMKWSEEEMHGIMNLFTAGGDTRAIGVMQATTAYAQVVPSAERAMELEDQALDVFAKVRA